MPEAPRPPDEKQRQVSLDLLKLTDTPIDKRFDRITRLVCNALDVPMACFTLVDRDRLWFKSSQGMGNIIEHGRAEAFCSHTILSDEIMMVENANLDARFSDNPRVKDGVVFYAGCPIHAPDGTRIGALCGIDDKPRQLNQDQTQLLRDLAGIVESELKLERLNEKNESLLSDLASAERLARIDTLTRIWNRKGINDILQKEWAESLRQKKPFSVVLADIDYFKKINDSHGHAAGDQVLQEVARRFVSALRIEDTIGRYGGEEFLIFLNNCHANILFETVERLRMDVTNRAVSIGNQI